MSNSIAKAEGVVASLEKKREACVRHGVELADERANVALAAHTGDAAARKKLDALNRESVEHASARIGHACFEEIDVNIQTGGRADRPHLVHQSKNNPNERMPTLAYRLVNRLVVGSDENGPI